MPPAMMAAQNRQAAGEDRVRIVAGHERLWLAG